MNRAETIQLTAEPVEMAEGTSIGLALILLVLGASMAVAGVYILAGTGWALIAGAVPVILLALTIFRGMKRGA